jgi:serine phosphatase RsbU (regulator of sigma subunit)
LAKEIKALDDIKRAEKTISEVYEKSNNPAQAFIHYKAYIIARDSILNAENTKKTVQSEMNFSFAKKQAEQKLEQQKKDAITKAVIIAVSGILLLVLLFTIFLVKSSRKISGQKSLLQEKNKEITDSITYAKRIQQAILPPDTQIKKYFPESFVLYKPKDIVAGDFYWMEKIDDKIFFAAADCTGHGVSGAMVSVVCSNALNRAVKEFGLTDPGLILDKTTELVVETFSKSESEVKDGMDISLCSLNTNTLEVKWAGANNPLRFTQNGAVKEFEPNKQPIGKYENQKPFTTQAVQLSKGDTLYLFSDGYHDQFGGTKGKKFMRKRFKEKLDANRHLKMKEQGELLNTEFETWKGDSEQIDDVLVMGVKL